jgi:hypothetical protein
MICGLSLQPVLESERGMIDSWISERHSRHSNNDEVEFSCRGFFWYYPSLSLKLRKAIKS